MDATTGTEAGRTRVLIAIPTFRRNDVLPALIDAVRADAQPVDADWRILLVDNDPDAGASSLAAELDVTYLHVAAPGSAAARQGALDAAESGELVVMIDDDLVPETGWLQGLIDAWRTYRPSAVMGYVRYVWPADADPWVAAGGFMRRTRFPTGTLLDALSTGNALIDTDAARALGIGFDASLGTSGGDDLDFGHRLLQAGGTIVASAESVARDDIVPERTTRAFARRRAVAQGQVRVRVLSKDDDPAARIAKRAGFLVGGLIRLPLFTAVELIARLRGDIAKSAVYQRKAWFARGRVTGALGRFRHEYVRDQPSPRPTPSERPR